MSIARRLISISGGDLRPFKFTIRISSANTQFLLPLTSPNGIQPNVVVNWGDGSNTSTITSITSPDRFHTYASTGDYQITISGYCSGFNVNNGTNRLLYRSVDDWGNISLEQVDFYGCSNLSVLPNDGSGNATLNDGLNSIKRFNSTFRGTGITYIPNGLFDFSSNVTSFVNTFVFCQGITTIPSGLFDNNSLATSFSGTFNACLNLTTIPSGLFDNNPLVVTFESIFRNCRSLTQIPEALFNGNQSVTTFSNAFNMATTANALQNGSTPTDLDGDEIFERTPTPIGTNCFAFCSGLSNFGLIPSTFK